MPAGSVFAFLAEQRTKLFPAEMFEDLFSSGRGRPSLPPDVVAAVMVLQTLHGLSDRQAAEAVRFDLRWKAAVGLPVTAEGFHPTALTVWRNRLAASARPHRIFEAVREVVLATGVLRGKARRALDSTILDDAVARQDTVTQLIAAVRRVGQEVPGAADLIPAVCTGYDYTRTGKPDIAWDDQGAREELVSALVNDALALLDRLSDLPAVTVGLDEPARDRAEQAVALLALVAGQDVEPAEGSDGTDGRWRIARKVAPDRMISTVDPDARHAHKTRNRRQDGFKAHVVVEPDTGLITATGLTKACGPTTATPPSVSSCWAPTPASPIRTTQPTSSPTSRVLDRRLAAGCRSWVTRHTAAARRWPSCRPRATRQSSSHGRCVRPCRVDSPARTSPWTRPSGQLPARTA